MGYTYEAGVYTPKNYELYNDALVTHNYLLNVGISYEGEDGDNSFSYNISLKTNSEFPMPEIIGKDYPNHYQHMQEIKTYIVYYVS